MAGTGVLTVSGGSAGPGVPSKLASFFQWSDIMIVGFLRFCWPRERLTRWAAKKGAGPRAPGVGAAKKIIEVQPCGPLYRRGGG